MENVQVNSVDDSFSTGVKPVVSPIIPYYNETVPAIGDYTMTTVAVDSDMSNQIGEIATALALAQGELDSAKKDSDGYGYNYSDLATVISTAKPVLQKHGLAVVQLVGYTEEKNVTVTTILTHSSGQFFRSVASLPVIDMKGCNQAQGAGASLSYLRRYAYQAILGMASEDNDASSDGPKKKSSKRVAASASSQPAKAEKKTSTKKTSFRRKKVEDQEDDI